MLCEESSHFPQLDLSAEKASENIATGALFSCLCSTTGAERFRIIPKKLKYRPRRNMYVAEPHVVNNTEHCFPRKKKTDANRGEYPFSKNTCNTTKACGSCPSPPSLLRTLELEQTPHPVLGAGSSIGRSGPAKQEEGDSEYHRYKRSSEVILQVLLEYRAPCWRCRVAAQGHLLCAVAWLCALETLVGVSTIPGIVL